MPIPRHAGSARHRLGAMSISKRRADQNAPSHWCCRWRVEIYRPRWSSAGHATTACPSSPANVWAWRPTSPPRHDDSARVVGGLRLAIPSARSAGFDDEVHHASLGSSQMPQLAAQALEADELRSSSFPTGRFTIRRHRPRHRPFGAGGRARWPLADHSDVERHGSAPIPNGWHFCEVESMPIRPSPGSTATPRSTISGPRREPADPARPPISAFAQGAGRRLMDRFFYAPYGHSCRAFVHGPTHCRTPTTSRRSQRRSANCPGQSPLGFPRRRRGRHRTRRVVVIISAVSMLGRSRVNPISTCRPAPIACGARSRSAALEPSVASLSSGITMAALYAPGPLTT